MDEGFSVMQLGDKFWRMNNLYKVVDKSSKLVMFKMNKVQNDIYNNRSVVGEGRVAKDVYLKARQLGVTTYHLIDALDDIIFNNNYKAEFISIGEDEMQKSFNTIKIAFDNLPLHSVIDFRVKEYTSSSLVLGNNSSIRVAISSRSGTVQYLHVSELAKIASKFPIRANEIVTGSFPAVPIGGRIVVESTAEGGVGEFKNIWTKAGEGKGFKPHFYGWYYDEKYVSGANGIIAPEENDLRNRIKKRYGIDVADNQLMFYREKREELDERVKQEYPSFPEEAFLQVGRPVFNMKYLKVSGQEALDPVEGVNYVMGVDVADMGEDLSIFKILDARDGKVVMNYTNKLPVEDFARDILKYATKFNNAIIIWESNGVGVSLRYHLKDYPNVYKSRLYEKGLDEDTGKIGFQQTSKNKSLIIDELKQALKEGWIILTDPQDVEELAVFQYKDNGKMEAPKGSHDDRVMALALAVHALLENPQEEIIKVKKVLPVIQRLRDSFSVASGENW